MLYIHAIVRRPQTQFTFEGVAVVVRQFRCKPALEQLLDDLLGPQ